MGDRRSVHAVIVAVLVLLVGACTLPSEFTYDCPGVVTDPVENTAGDSAHVTLTCTKQE